MSRQPTHLTLVGGKGPRQRLWDAIRAAAVRPDGQIDPVVQIDSGWLVRTAKTNDSLASEYLRGLLAAGYLMLACDPQRGKPKLYRLTRDNGLEAPRVRRDGSPVTQGLAQEQMWRTLRICKTDTNARELAAYASSAMVPVDEAATKAYLQALHQAGYLTLVAEGKGQGRGGIQARYRLSRDTGPKPPMIQKTHAVFDPNLGEIVWVRPVTEEDAIYGQ